MIANIIKYTKIIQIMYVDSDRDIESICEDFTKQQVSQQYLKNRPEIKICKCTCRMGQIIK